MFEKKTRRLVAIMFTDIAGYTRLMQESEMRANQLRQRHREVFEHYHEGFNGEILQYYGDGTLSIFDSCLDAVQCAIAMQQALLQQPSVPLRIGIHLGDIVQSESDIYGDGVNLAARVESLGVPHAVLISEDVRKQIKNHEIEAVSMGLFEMKNVQRPIEVFAIKDKGLVVPKPGDIIHGKGKLLERPSASSRSWLRYSMTGFLVILLGALLFWALNSRSAHSQEDIIQERIAVLPFENLTGNPELEIIGQLSADWINHGLMELEDVQVISPFTLQIHKEVLDVSGNNPTTRADFSDLTGAKYLIIGKYYEERGELVFRLEMIDAISGELRKAFHTIRGSSEKKEELLTHLREEVVSYWFSRKQVDMRQITVPKYEAYKLFLETLNSSMASDGNIPEILAIDSTFHLARIHYLNLNRAGVRGDTKKHFEFLERHIHELSSYEKAWFSYLRALFLGRIEKAFFILENIRLKYPGDILLNMETAALALESLHNPQLALSIYDELETEVLPSEKIGNYYNFRIIAIVSCHIQLGDLISLEKFLSDVKSDFRYNEISFHLARLCASHFLEDDEMFQNAYTNLIKSASEDPLLYIFYVTVLEHTNYFPHPFRSILLRDAKKILDNIPQIYAAYPNFFAYVDKIPQQVINLEQMTQIPVGLQISNLLYGALTMIEAGNLDLTEEMLGQLDSYTTPNLLIAAQWGAGDAYYSMAVINAQLGRTELAVEQLKQAKHLGFPRYIMRYDFDRRLASCYDHPDFKKLLHPVWPGGIKPSK